MSIKFFAARSVLKFTFQFQIKGSNSHLSTIHFDFV